MVPHFNIEIKPKLDIFEIENILDLNLDEKTILQIAKEKLTDKIKQSSQQVLSELIKYKVILMEVGYGE